MVGTFDISNLNDYFYQSLALNAYGQLCWVAKIKGLKNQNMRLFR